MGSSLRQRAATQHPVCQDVFGKAQDHHVGTSTILTWPSPMWLFLFPKIKSALKGTGFKSMQWRQQRWSSWISYQKTTCSIASNSGRFAWSGVGIGEGCTSRVTTFYCVIFWIKIVLTSVRLFYSHTIYFWRPWLLMYELLLWLSHLKLDHFSSLHEWNYTSLVDNTLFRAAVYFTCSQKFT